MGIIDFDEHDRPLATASTPVSVVCTIKIHHHGRWPLNDGKVQTLSGNVCGACFCVKEKLVGRRLKDLVFLMSANPMWNRVLGRAPRSPSEGKRSSMCTLDENKNNVLVEGVVGTTNPKDVVDVPFFKCLVRGQFVV